jgi:predicted nucleic acid-binding protein
MASLLTARKKANSGNRLAASWPSWRACFRCWTSRLAPAKFYGSIRAALAARGDIIGNNDLWIAAHAKAAGLILVTNNEREFRRIDGLEIQNWAD